ncbi:hypothetical protein [Bradyrhizobium valentinum]|uniref:Lysozyme inhibitor LprI N-terminal domain-containing protein n=1 Tax=Bradyrhizobium valentinum TaxID=1518501 RepID=A0A0R3L1Y4_9BRAD|nr:hypothetical protein [Bradyrhizobium valentinum]KRQ99298.1 hypothetical protein CP49_11930 [Bradyrhizobium valentinum]
MRTIATALALILIPASAQAFENAIKCSDAALTEYAIANPMEPAERIADAAFEKCLSEWKDYIDRERSARAYAHSKPIKAGEPRPPAPPDFHTALDEVRGEHQRQAIPKVIEARACRNCLRTVRAGMLAVPSRVAARLPHLSKHDVAEIDAEIRAVLGEIGN